MPKQRIDDIEEIIDNGPFPIRFPGNEETSQDKEYCEVQIDGQWQKIRFHDYEHIYKIPGLYETIFYRTLRCDSPNRVTNILGQILLEKGQEIEGLRVLDFGAGNGMSGEALHSIGIRKIIAVDILPEAKEANWRDRPWVYYDYLVSDFTNITKEHKSEIEEFKPNALLTVAALGFGDIPTKAFTTAFNLIEKDGWIAFNLHEQYVGFHNKDGFAGLINKMIEDNYVRIEIYKRYLHRYTVTGEPIYYIALVAQKLKSL